MTCSASTAGVREVRMKDSGWTILHPVSGAVGGSEGNCGETLDGGGLCETHYTGQGKQATSAGT